MVVTYLNTRGKEILRAIVEAYIETVTPVSSQHITQRLRLHLSAATIRNVMAELDILGFIWQPHTSAGRIPTDKGYRYYIDTILQPEQLTLQERELLGRQAFAEDEAFDELLTEFLHILSNFSKYTAVAFSCFDKDRFYVTGASYILEQPEFQDAQKLQPILKSFEREEPLLAIMKEDLKQDGVKIHIGSENLCEEIQECSLVISNFKIRARNMGVLGIIGPRRMSYPKVISTVDYVAQAFGERMAGFDIWEAEERA